MVTRLELPNWVIPLLQSRAVKALRTGCFVLAALSIDAPARAAETSSALQVLSIQSDDAVDAAQAVTLALKSSAKRQSAIKLVPGDYSLEVLSLALGCADPPDDPCLAKIGAKIKADAFIWGSLTKDGKKLDLKLNLYRQGEPSRSTELRYNADKVEDDALSAIADRALGTLLMVKKHAASDEDTEETGRLLLSADELDGQIIIDGAPAGDIHDGHAQLELPVGDHDVSVRVDGYRDAEGTVTISASKRALLRLHPEKVGTTHAAHDETEGDTDSGSASAGWGAIVVGGVFAATGVFATLRVNSINHDSDFNSYRAGIPGNEDACVAANREVMVSGAASPDRISSLCSQSKTFVALEYVFFGLGAVSAGTGALILLTSDQTPAPKTDALRANPRHSAGIQPSVSVGPHSAALALRLHF